MTLLPRIEEASGGSRALDCEIARVFGWHRVEPRFARNKHGGWIAPEDFMGVLENGAPRLDSLHGTTIHRDPFPFTTSLDAPLALAERVLPKWFVGIQQNRGDVPPWSAFLSPPDRRADDIERDAKTAPLALCAAILKAKETTQ